MTFDLFSQSLLFFLYLISSTLIGISIYFLLRVPQPPHIKKKAHNVTVDLKKRLIISDIITVSTIAVAVAIWASIQFEFPEDQIPIDVILWAIPASLSLCLCVAACWKWRMLPLPIGALIISCMLSAAIINNYYHYFPTLQAVFRSDQATSHLATTAENTASLQTTASLEQYFLPLPAQPRAGILQSLDIPSTSGNFTPKQGRLYTPPAARLATQIRFPVIILLAGLPGSPIDWEQSGIETVMNQFASQHKGLAPYVAMVDFTGVKNQDTECTDSPLGNAETYLTKDVPNYLKQHLAVQTDPKYWAIGGYSAGGTCGPIVALRNPNVYRNYFDVSGDTEPSDGSPEKTLATLFSGSSQVMQDHSPNHLLATSNPTYKTMSAWYYIGKQDKPKSIADMRHHVELAKNAGITVSFNEVPGSHTFLVWKQGFVDGLPWLSNRMQLTTYDKK